MKTDVSVKTGDIVRWSAINGTVYGTVRESDGRLIVELNDGHTFRLEDLAGSATFEVILRK